MGHHTVLQGDWSDRQDPAPTPPPPVAIKQPFILNLHLITLRLFTCFYPKQNRSGYQGQILNG